MRSEGPTPIVIVFRCRTYSAPFPHIHPHRQPSRTALSNVGLTALFNHERKRAYPFNLCNLCSKKLTTDISDLTDFHPERKRAYPFNPCNLCSKKLKRKRAYPFNPFNLCSKKLTTDIRDLTDANPDENRDYALKGHDLHLALGIALGFSVHVIFAL